MSNYDKKCKHINMFEWDNCKHPHIEPEGMGWVNPTKEAKLLARVKRLEKALEHYANNFKPFNGERVWSIGDAGKVAKEALQADKEDGK